MKTTSYLLILTTLLTVISCENYDESVNPNPTLIADSQVETQVLQEQFDHELSRYKPVSKSTSKMYSLLTGEPISKAFSKLIRTPKAVLSFIHARDLTPHTAYTMWMMVFNNPQYCTGGVCDENDIFNDQGEVIVNEDGTVGTPGVNLSAMWIQGMVSSEKGTANFYFKVQQGVPPGEVLFGPGLADTMGSEIQYVIRDHGPEIPGRLEEQLNSYAGGCNVYHCSDVQFAVHKP